jgi:hypothetical protein
VPDRVDAGVKFELRAVLAWSALVSHWAGNRKFAISRRRANFSNVSGPFGIDAHFGTLADMANIQYIRLDIHNA